MTDRQSALLHRRARQRRKSDHVADGINMRHIGLVIGVDLQAFAVVCLETRAFEIQRHRGSLSADGVKKRLRAKSLAALEGRQNGGAVGRPRRADVRSWRLFRPDGA